MRRQAQTLKQIIRRAILLDDHHNVLKARESHLRENEARHEQQPNQGQDGLPHAIFLQEWFIA
jgi:hypothetical protein